MIEVRIHGRGGQGNVVAAYLLAIAAIDEGKFGQAFPAFGAERRGAPVVSFVRIADTKLLRHNQVKHPSFLIIQDQALLHSPGVTDGLVAGGGILVNSGLDSDSLSEQSGFNLTTFPADRISQEYLGHPLPNTALLAAFLALTQLLPIDALLKALNYKFTGTLLENNTRLIKDIFNMVPSAKWMDIANAQRT